MRGFCDYRESSNKDNDPEWKLLIIDRKQSLFALVLSSLFRTQNSAGNSSYG